MNDAEHSIIERFIHLLDENKLLSKTSRTKLEKQLSEGNISPEEWIAIFENDRSDEGCVV